LPSQELLKLEGHKNVVYAIAFNNPFGDKGTHATVAVIVTCVILVITGSFDKTCKLWDANTGQLYHTLRFVARWCWCCRCHASVTPPCSGHEKEIVCVAFNPQGNIISTGSTDNTVRPPPPQRPNFASGELVGR
jgi:dynein assembly factor with WDR repeat domains 1